MIKHTEEFKQEAVWIDVVRSPHTAELVAVEKLTRRQSVALGMMRALVEG